MTYPSDLGLTPVTDPSDLELPTFGGTDGILGALDGNGFESFTVGESAV